MMPLISVRRAFDSLLTLATNLDRAGQASAETEATSLANIQYSEVRNTGFASEPQSRQRSGEEQF